MISNKLCQKSLVLKESSLLRVCNLRRKHKSCPHNSYSKHENDLIRAFSDFKAFLAHLSRRLRGSL